MAPPEELQQLVLGLTAGAELAERGAQRTRRTVVNLCGPDGMPLLGVVADLVSLTSGPLAGSTYREVEVESLRDNELAPIVAELLVQAGATSSKSKSKGVRAVAGDQPLAPLVPPVERVRPRDPAAAAVTNNIRTHVHSLIEQDLRVRQGLPDSVHQFRVAARRLRSGCQAFSPLLDEEWAEHLRGELGWIADVLGAARDREVLERRLFAAIRQLPLDVDRAAAFVAVQDRLESQLATANEQIDAAMRSDRYLALLDVMYAGAAEAPTTPLAEEPAKQVLPPLVKKRWKKLSREADKLHDEMQGHDEHWHKTRITAKKARYTVEACIPVFGGPAKKLAKQLESVTDLLGEHQDCAVAADTVHSLINKDTGPRAAFALGALYAMQRQRTQTIRQEFVNAWPRISHTEWRKWLNDGAVH